MGVRVDGALAEGYLLHTYCRGIDNLYLFEGLFLTVHVRGEMPLRTVLCGKIPDDFVKYFRLFFRLFRIENLRKFEFACIFTAHRNTTM